MCVARAGRRAEQEVTLASSGMVRTLLTQFQERGYMAALAIMRDPFQAEDALQAASAKTLMAADRYDVGAPFYPWYYRILKNHCLDEIRKRKPQVAEPHALIERLPAPGDPESDAIRAQRDAVLHRALAGLGESHREIVQLRHWQDMSYEEIAQVLDMPVGTVMSRLYRARRALQDALNADPNWSP